MPDKNKPGTMPIRRWVTVLIIGLFLAPVLALAITGGILFAPTSGPVFPSEDAIDRLQVDVDQWTDPAWREDAAAWLQDDDMDVVLLQDGEVIWQTSDHADQQDGRVIHSKDVSATRSFILYAPDDDGPPSQLGTWIVPVAILSALVIAVLLIAWFLRRSIIEPLTATSEAAQQLAAGSYLATIPHSRVREVNDLASSFEQMRESLQASLTRQAAVEEERRFLISAVAHDLRTPLFALRGSLEGIIQGVADTDEKRDQYLQIALRRANDLDKLISDLFAWSRLELTELEVGRSQIQLAETIERATEGIRPAADKRGIEIVSAGQGATVPADAQLLRRALDNLLDNALTHSPDNETIEVATMQEPGEVVISIRDHGPGIPEEDLERIFRPLYRGDESRNRKTGGAGLGLGVARRIAEAHEGSLRARNHAESGAVFELRLPTG